MKPHEIREARAQRVNEMRAMLNKAEAGKRSLNAEEQARFDVLKAEISGFETQEQRAVFLAEAERSMSAEPVSEGDDGFSTLEQRVSIMNVIRAGTEGRPLSGAEAEYHKETERRTGRTAKGFFIPLSVIERRVNTTGTASQIVPKIHRPDLYIEPLRDVLLARRLGVRVLSGLTGNLGIPKFGSGMSVGWVGENEAVPDSGMTFEGVELSPKHAGGITELSRQLIQQSSPDAEQLITDDLRYMMAKAIDSALIKGGGPKEPKGVLSAAGTQAASLATLDWQSVLKMLELLDLENVAAANWLMSTKVKTKFAATEKSTNTGIYLLNGGSIADLPAYSTNQVPNADTDKGTVPYDVWIRQGFVETTEGDVIDYEVIRAKINTLSEKYHIQEIAIDRWNATQLSTQLTGDGFTMFGFGQGFASMSAPCKEMEKRILGKEINHGGNPVLRWMASNVAVSRDPADNIKPNKAKSTERIDGVVASLMALGRCIATEEQAPSRYATNGIIFI